jgi:hypothetical protein
MFIQSLTLALLLSGTALGHLPSSHSGHPEIEVLVRATTGETLPGTTVALCPIDPNDPALPTPHDPAWASCKVAGTDHTGVVHFRRIAPGHYVVTADANGFAISSVYPLSIAGPDPIAPDQLLIVLNPTCHDCAGHKPGGSS